MKEHARVSPCTWFLVFGPPPGRHPERLQRGRSVREVWYKVDAIQLRPLSDLVRTCCRDIFYKTRALLPSLPFRSARQWTFHRLCIEHTHSLPDLLVVFITVCPRLDGWARGDEVRTAQKFKEEEESSFSVRGREEERKKKRGEFHFSQSQTWMIPTTKSLIPRVGYCDRHSLDLLFHRHHFFDLNTSTISSLSTNEECSYRSRKPSLCLHISTEEPRHFNSQEITGGRMRI